MYRCNNCRKLTDEVMTIKTETGPVSGCPWCGVDDLEEVEICQDCGEAFDRREIFGGRCLVCLRETIDYPTALGYLLARDHLREFLRMTDGRSADRATRSGLIQAFITHEADDRQREKPHFLDECRVYILADRVCAHDFADWLEGDDKA